MTTIQDTKGTTTMQGKFDLIKGEYTPEEALEIVTHVLLKKINFHELPIYDSILIILLLETAS